MPELSAAPSINDSRTQALLELMARLADLDLAPLLIYRIDSVPAGALPFLAFGQVQLAHQLRQLVLAGPDSGQPWHPRRRNAEIAGWVSKARPMTSGGKAPIA